MRDYQHHLYPKSNRSPRHHPVCSCEYVYWLRSSYTYLIFIYSFIALCNCMLVYRSHVHLSCNFDTNKELIMIQDWSSQKVPNVISVLPGIHIRCQRCLSSGSQGREFPIEFSYQGRMAPGIRAHSLAGYVRESSLCCNTKSSCVQHQRQTKIWLAW